MRPCWIHRRPLDRLSNPLRAAKPDILLATPLRCHPEGVAMEREDDLAVRAAAVEYNGELRRTSAVLRAAARKLCANSKETRERSAAIHERCRKTHARAAVAGR